MTRNQETRAGASLNTRLLAVYCSFSPDPLTKGSDNLQQGVFRPAGYWVIVTFRISMTF
jgi:hypothetical protein